MSTEHLQSGNDRESLSALFDGELHGEAARFALKRLGHDAQWQQACGSWQLIGDVLRGRGTSAASSGLAARVAEAVAQEPPVVVMEFARPVQAPARSSRAKRWAGGVALAASAAFAALFVARPPTPMDEGSRVSAPVAAISAPETPSVAATPLELPPAAASEAPALESADVTRTIAAVTPRRAQPSQRTRTARAESRSRREAASTRATAALAANAVPSPASEATGSDPFGPAQEIVTRPWPRAVLPNSQAAGALTASFDSPALSSPSFYPFEPQLPADSAPLPAPPQP